MNLSEGFNDFYATFGTPQLLSSLAGIGILVCWILVIVQAFRNDDTSWGIFLIITSLFCGFGGLLTYIAGWLSANRWGTAGIMILWTILLFVWFFPIAFF
jgi:hypothetical protein